MKEEEEKRCTQGQETGVAAAAFLLPPAAEAASVPGAGSQDVVFYFLGTIFRSKNERDVMTHRK